MWDRLRKQIAVEREQLRELITTHRPLLEKCTTEVPNSIELSALGAMLHAFYTGVENIFRRIEVEAGDGPPEGPAWHRRLLKVMTESGDRRPPVVSTALTEILQRYLAFRHVFRQAYTFQLQWAKMSELVLECEATFERLEQELERFLDALPPGR